MFTVQSYRKREWSRVNENITVPAKQFNIAATAFLGAIGFNEGVIHFKLYRRSVDRWKFIDWL